MKQQVIRYALLPIGATLLTLVLMACSESAPSQPQTAAERGLAFVTANGCTACHALDSTRGIGPGWGGSFGTTRTLRDGRSVAVDATYLRRALVDPAVDVVESYENIMLPAAVTEAQIADIIAMISELESTLSP